MEEELQRAFIDLDSILSAKTINGLVSTNSDEKAIHCFVLGVYLRNKYLWNKSALYNLLIK